ncbi:MAG: response regulator transcription factor [Ferruginibacter sp.]
MPADQTMRLALVDDHVLFRKGLISLIEAANPNFTIVLEANNGIDLRQKLTKHNTPDIILVDINMPQMDGFACVQWLHDNFRHIKVIVVSMVDQEETILRMYKLGVKAYLTKTVEPEDLRKVLKDVMANYKGFYYTDLSTGELNHFLPSR